MASSPSGRAAHGRTVIAFVIALVALAFAGSGAQLLWSWRTDQRAAQVRIDVLGRERALVMSAVGQAQHLTITSGVEEERQLLDTLELLEASWDAVTLGGPELGLDLAPTGRTVDPWPPASDRADLVGRLDRFLAHARAFATYGPYERVDSLESLESEGDALFVALNDLVRHAGEESFDDHRFALSAVLFVASAALVVLLAVSVLARLRRRAASDAARSDADERMRRLMEHAHDAMFVLARDGTPLWVSPSFPRVMHRPAPTCREEVLAMVHPDDEMPLRDKLRDVFREVGTSSSLEARLHGSDGGWRHMRILATNHTDDPLLGGLLITMTDITEERRAAAELARAAALHQFLADNSSDLMLRTTSEGQIVYASSAAGPLLGVYPDDIVGAHVTQIVEAEDVAAFEAALEEARHSGGVATVDVRASMATAWRSVWLGVSCQYVIGPDNDREFHVSMRDITERVDAARRLAEERQILEATLGNVRAGVLAVDAEATVVKVNAAYVDLLGFCPELGETLVDFVHRFQMLDGDGRPFELGERPLARALGGESVIDLPATLIDALDRRHEILANAVPMFDQQGHLTGAALTIHDVTTLRAAEDELRQLATVDALTELPNRRRLMQHLEGAIGRTQRTPRRLNVMFLDLDGFKAVNDELGHEAGDELLVAVARRLEATMRTGDLVARLGGDEFVVVVENLDDPELVSMLVGRIERVLSIPFELSTGDVQIGGSVGVVTNDGHSAAEELLARADAAMYERKRSRKASAAA